MTPINPNAPVPILLVEENRGDLRLIREALLESRILKTLHVASDGEEAMAFLRRREPFARAPRPRLILLDLNLPKKDGREVLAEIKADPDLRSIPVVILTTSKAEADVYASYDGHANCYVAKSANLEGFLKTVRLVVEFWLTVVELPPLEQGAGHA